MVYGRPVSASAAVQAGELPRAQTIYTELKPLLEFIVPGGLATTVEAGLASLGAAVGDASPAQQGCRRRAIADV